MKKTACVIAFLMCLSFTSPSVFAQSPPPPPPHPDYVGKDWIDFAPKDGGFSDKLPKPPTEQLRPVEVEPVKVEQHVFSVKTDLGEYVVQYTDFSMVEDGDALAEAIFSSSKDAVAKKFGKVVAEETLDLNGSPGQRLDIELTGAPPMMMLTRTYIISKRLYQLILVQPKLDGRPEGVKALYQGNAKRFFDSFRMVQSENPSTR